MNNVADLIVAKIAEFGAPVCIGLDPFPELFPDELKASVVSRYGDTVQAVVEAIYEFNVGIISATADICGVYKPQIAFYEQYGAPGYEVYQRTIRALHDAGKVVIDDSKRGDIGSTATAYAAGHIGKATLFSGSMVSCLDADFVTVNGYLGSDGIKPFSDFANQGKGIFVLAKTSNPSSGELQDLKLENGRSVFLQMAELIRSWGEGSIGDSGYSSIGAVVGTTWPEEAAILRKALPGCFFLVPGYGAQGAKGTDVRACFNPGGQGAVVNSSRGILYALRRPALQGMHWKDAAREATLEMRKDINSALK
ncbi:MAG: orotidine-5'-phosphate decarboxylase [bacterium]|nr:orotidine-5'-phosphate decarboxylase [bacterium]